MSKLRSMIGSATVILATVVTVAIVLPNVVAAQSQLPECPAHSKVPWTNCQGTYTSPNGNKYVGEWVDDKKNGQGTFIGKWSGDKYVGEWKDDKKNGQGTYTFSSGAKYVGEFKDGKFDGRGTLYAPDATIKQSGIWKDNKFVGKARDNPK